MHLGISKSTVSLWMKEAAMSSFGIGRLNKRRRESNNHAGETLHKRKLLRINVAEREAEARIGQLTPGASSSLVILSTLYECEGGKDGRSIRFINSDPSIIRLFLATFRASFQIDETKLRAIVHLHDYHVDDEIKKFWSLETGIPVDRFYGSHRKLSTHAFKKEGYKGCICIVYHDAHLIRVIRGFAKKLIRLYI